MPRPPTPTDDAAAHAQLVSYLPDRVWYLSNTGADMWCRRPYSFFFTTSDAASAFAAEVAADLSLSPIGVDASVFISDDSLSGLRAQQVTRIFLDPRVDPVSGDIFGTILRLGEVH